MKVQQESLVSSVLPKYLGRKVGKISKQKGREEEQTASKNVGGGGDKDKEMTEAKCSMVGETHQVPRCEVKRSLVKDSEGEQ